MSASEKSARLITVALNLPEGHTPEYIIHARHIVACMTGNHWFPKPVPSLTVVQLAIEELNVAQVAAETNAKGTATARDAKRAVVHALLQQLGSYVQAIANANLEHAAEIVESAGMDLKKSRGPGGRVFKLDPTGHEGELQVTVPKAGDNASYEYQYSLDGGATWLPFPQLTTNYTKVTLKGLKSHSTVWVRYRFTLKGVTYDWSDKRSIVVD